MKLIYPCLLALILAGTAPSLSAQSRKVDSLRNEVKQNRRDTAMVQSCNYLGNLMNGAGKPDSALYYLDLGLAVTAELFKDSAVYDSAAFSRIKIRYGSACNQKGEIYRIRGDYLSAMKNYSEALRVYKAIDNVIGLAAVYNNIGLVQFTQQQYVQAEEQFRLAIDMNKRKGGSPVFLGRNYNNLVMVYSEMGDSVKAREYCMRSIVVRDSIKDSLGLASSYNHLGRINLLEKKYDEAARSFRKAMDICDALDFDPAMVEISSNFAQLYLAQGLLDSAVFYIEMSARLMGGDNGITDKEHYHFIRSGIDSALGNYKSAYEHYKLYKMYADSIADENSVRKITELGLRNEFEMIQEKERIKQEQDKADAEAEIEKHKQQRNYLIGGFALVLILACVVLIAYRQKRTSERLLAEKNAVIEEKQRDVMDSISYAQRLQRAILATPEEITQHIPENFLFYKPKDIVAGDFYFFETTPTHIFIAAADCTGHGVPGALVSVVCSNALTRCVKEFNLSDPGLILDKAREIVIETFRKSGQDVKDGMDISLLVISKGNQEVKWAGANNPLWFVRNEALEEIKGDKQPIGKSENPLPFVSHSISGTAGTTFYLLTDGYADQFGGDKGKKFKYKQLKDLLLANRAQNLPAQHATIERAFESWRGNLEQVDDVCVIGIRI